MLETVSAPFVKHSHKINVIHPRINGEFEVSKVVSSTNESGFIRTYIYPGSVKFIGESYTYFALFCSEIQLITVG